MTWMRLRLSLAAVLLLAGCGRSENEATQAAAGAPPPAAKPDVIVTFDAKTHGCVVALSREAQGSAIACEEVLPFVRDELRVPSGSLYEVRTTADVDTAQVAKVDANLKGAGYRLSVEH